MGGDTVNRPPGLAFPKLKTIFSSCKIKFSDNYPMTKPKHRKPTNNTIAQNKRARFDYHLITSFEAGVSLQGWEVKALRAGKVQLTDSYVFMKGGEAFLFGANISPLPTASRHSIIDPMRTRKLLLSKKELALINAGISQKGQTCVCTSLYWRGHLVKAKVDLAQGKKLHDKRSIEKDRDWERQKVRLVHRNLKR